MGKSQPRQWPDGTTGWTPGKALWLLGMAGEALAELARARIVLARVAAGGIPALNAVADRQGGAGDRVRVTQVGWIVPRISSRVPWRADCLVQAIAAQRMLLRRQIASRIVVGVENGPETGFCAHAWLACGDDVVMGGEVGRYAVLLGEDDEAKAARPATNKYSSRLE